MRTLAWGLVLLLGVLSLTFDKPTVESQVYTVTVSVIGIPPELSTNLSVDSSNNGTIKSGQVRTFNFQTGSLSHTITVDYYVPGVNGTRGVRFYCKENRWTFSSSGSRTFNYIPQYTLSVESRFGTVSGAGWYDKDSVATVSLSSTVVAGGTGVRYIFTGWNGDITSKEAKIENIVMNGPKSLAASWKAQFYLALSTDPAMLTKGEGDGWYDAGTTAYFNVNPTITISNETRYVFTGWVGDVPSANPKGNILVNSPKSLTATYKMQHRLQVSFEPEPVNRHVNIPRGNWYDAGSILQLGPVNHTISGEKRGERFALVGWSVDQELRGGPSATIEMNRPHSVKLLYKPQYYIQVAASQGRAFGEGWYDAGTLVDVWASPPEENLIGRFRFNGWKIKPTTALDNSYELKVQIRADQAYSLEAVWEPDFAPFILGTLVIGGLITGGSLIAYKRSTIKNRFGPLLGSLRRRPNPSSPLPPPLQLTRRCLSCGSPIDQSTRFCRNCGLPQGNRDLKENTIDDKVYEYIVARNGVISMSQAAKDLGIAVDELGASTSRLKRAGRLEQ